MDNLVAIVVRHGDSAGNDLGLFRGWLDYPLTDLGREQAEQASSYISKFKIKTCVCSPLLRAFETANIISDVPIGQTRGLFPWSLGCFTGLSKDQNKEALELFVKNPNVVVPEGESLDGFLERQFTFWEQLLKASSRGLILVVAHNSCILALRDLIEGSSEEFAKEEVVSTGGIIGIYGSPGSYRIKVLFKQEKTETEGIVS